MLQTLIEVAYEGVCDKCKAVFCPFYGFCADDGHAAKCICPASCADVFIQMSPFGYFRFFKFFYNFKGPHSSMWRQWHHIYERLPFTA